MKKLKLFLFIFIVFFQWGVNAQWSVYQTYPDNDFYSLYALPNGIFAGTANGMWYSSNSGGTWVSAGLTGLVTTAITATDSLNLFAAAGNGLILKSTNKGVNWTILTTLSKPVNCMTTSSSVIFAGTDSALYSIQISGTTALVISGKISSLASSGSKIFAGSTNGTVYFSSNGGTNWVTKTTQPKPNTNITALTFDGSIIYAGMAASSLGDTNSIYKSTNDGTNWTRYLCDPTIVILLRQPPPFVVMTASGNNITYGNSIYGVRHSTNGGTNWTTKNDTLGNRWIGAMILSNGKIFAGTKGGLFTSNWPNIVWSNNHFPDNQRGNIVVRLKRPPYGAFPTGTLFSASEKGLFRTSNHGTNWYPINNGLPNISSSSISAFSNGKMFAGTLNGVYTKLYTDSNWVYSNLSQSDIIDFTNSGSSVYAISPTSGVFGSSNNGNSWSAINTGLPNTSVNAIANTGDTLYCAVSNYGLYRAYPSTGFTWQNIFAQDSAIGSIKISGNNIYAYGDHFSKSTNSGVNWVFNDVIIQLRQPPAYKKLTTGFNNNDIYVTDPNSGIYRSTNQGNNWINISNEIGGINYLSIVTDSLNLYTSDEYGCIWKRPMQSILMGITTITNKIPSSFTLEQNYPNPFNPVTKIKFGLNKSGIVKLKIYDLLGRELKTLTNEYLNAGMYEINFNGSDFASGVYFYKLETNDFSENKKMILIK